MIKKILIVIIFSVSLQLYTQSYRISDIEISGLTKTRISTVLNIIDLKVGDDISETFIPVIRQNLLKENIFINDIVIKITPLNEYEALLEINLRDKWTIIPVPVVVVTSSGYLFGGVFVESNLLGLNHSLVTGLFYNGDNLSGFTAWELPQNSLGSFTVSSNYSTGDIVYYDFYGNETVTENYDRVGLKVKFENEIRNSLSLSISIKPSLNSQKLLLDGGLGLSFDNEAILPFLKQGVIASTEYVNRLSIEDSKIYRQISSEVSLSKAFSSIYLQLVLNGGYSFDSFYFPFLYGGSDGSKIFKTKSVKVKSYANHLLKFELKIFDLDWGYVTLPLYYESGILAVPETNQVYSYSGPGTGLTLYLKKIAFPAFGFNFTYDLLESRYKFSVALGYEY